MSELKAHHIIGLDGRCNSVDDDYYLKSEADWVIERIIKGAMSMFRESNRCRGLDTKSPLGRIADVAFKHWMYVERMEARITEKDKEIAELKEFIKNYQFDNINMLHKIMKQDAELRHHKHKRCLAMAKWCEATALWCYQAANTLPAGFHATLYGKPVMIEPARLFKRHVLLTKWSARWRELAEKFKEAK